MTSNQNSPNSKPTSPTKIASPTKASSSVKIPLHTVSVVRTEQKIKKEEQNMNETYLNKLIHSHQNRVPQIQNMLSQANQLYQSKIKIGQYDLKINGPLVRSRTNMSLQKNSPQRSFQKKSIDEKSEQSRLNQQKQRLNFLKQIKEEKKKRNQKNSAFFKQLKQKQTQKIEKERLQAERIYSQTKQKKKEQLKKRIQQIKSNKQKREEDLKNYEKQIKSSWRNTSLQQKMLEQFKGKQDQLLQQKKRKLAEIRQMHKPISRSQLQKHAQKIDEYKSARSRASNIEKPAEKHKFYRSVWHDVIRTAQEEKKNTQQDLDQSHKQLKQKQKNYAAHIRTNFIPPTDPHKSEQILKMKESNSKKHKQLEPNQFREAGLENLRYSKERSSKKSAPPVETSSLLTKNTKINYLQEFRGQHSSEDEVQRILKSHKYTEAEKVSKVVAYAEQIQLKARHMEQLNKIKGGLDEQLDQLYIKALSAKLKVLQ